MPSFIRIDIKTGLACQSPTTIGSLYPADLISSGDVLAIDEQESFGFAFSRTDKRGAVRPLATSLVAGLIASVVWSDASFDEWRLGTVETRHGGADGGVVEVTANPLILDLADAANSSTGAGLVSTLSSGLRIFSFTTDPITLDELWDTYIIPACPSWVSKGTIDSTTQIASLSWNRATPQAVAILGRDAIRNTGETAELRLRRNGITDYKLDCVAQVGASATVPLFHPRTSLQALRRKYDASEQGTRVFVQGSADPSGTPGILGRARWKVQSVVGTVVTLVDRNGGSSPIAFDTQLVGNYMYRPKTGRTFAITSSSASAGSVTCSGGVSTLAADEDVEFRKDEPLTNTLRLGAQDGAYHVRPYVISNVAGSVFTLTDDFGNVTAGADPVQVNNEHVDWYARRMTLVRATTANGNFSGGVLTNVLSTVGVAAGDIVFISLTGVPPYGFALNNGALVVDSTTVNSITVHARDDAALGTFAATPVSLRIYRPVTTLHRITASAAAGNTITVDAAGTAANTDVIEFIQVDGAGEIFSYLDHPTYVQAYPTGYGVKVKDLTVNRALGVTQLVPNGWMRTWTNSANPPDGWSLSGSGTFSQNTNTAFTRYGGLSYKWISAAGAAGIILSPVFYPSWGPGTTRVSVRFYFYFSTYSISGGANFTSTLTVYAATPAGAAGTSLGTWSIQPTDATGSSTKIVTGQWVKIDIKGITLNTGTAPYGLVAEFRPGFNANAGSSTGYLDAIECFPFTDSPTDACEFGDATVLHQSGNLFLTDKATPLPTYEFSIADLERLDPVRWSRNALTIGGSVRAYEPEIPIDTTVRLLRYERDHLRPTASRVVLANRPVLLTNTIAQAAAQQTRIISAIQQDQS